MTIRKHSRTTTGVCRVAAAGLWLMLASLVFTACGSDGTTPTCDEATCDGVCIGDRCESDVDATDALDIPPDVPETPDVEELPDTTDVRDLPDAGDVEVADDTEDSEDSEDAPDVDSGAFVPAEYPLFERCRVGMQQCSDPGAVCLDEFTYSDNATIAELGDLKAGFPTSDALGAPQGICTRLCNGADGSEEGACGSLAGEGYSCLLVAEYESTYPEGGAVGDVAMPFDGELDPTELVDGTPYLAICVPPGTRSAPDICSPCQSNFDCTAGSCIADESGERFCAHPCDSDAYCGVGFACSDAGYCMPELGVCAACRDMDNDGRGGGACRVRGLDCDDSDPFVHARGVSMPGENFGVLLPDSACIPDEARDTNCDGVNDANQLLGLDAPFTNETPGVPFPQRHCSACDVGCPEFNPADAAPNTVGQRCIVEDGAGRCGMQCAEGYADCNGNPEDGCEVDMSAAATCGGCTNGAEDQPAGLDCSDLVSGTGLPVLCAEGPAADHCPDDAAPGAEFHCEIGDGTVFDSCPTRSGDCDGCAANGCETDLATADGHCGVCENACDDLAGGVDYPNVLVLSCVEGTCERDTSTTTSGCAASLDARFADCGVGPGCATDLRTDAEFCGSCTNSCDSTESCRSGVCVATSCESGVWANCDGAGGSGSCEQNILGDVYCGACATIDEELPGFAAGIGRDCEADERSNVVTCSIRRPNRPYQCEQSWNADCPIYPERAQRSRLGVECRQEGGSNFREFACLDQAGTPIALDGEDDDALWWSAAELEQLLETDDAHCGACGNACPLGYSCVDGACGALSCDGVVDADGVPLGNCDGDGDGDPAGNGCETRLDDASNCGDCGITCGASGASSSGCALVEDEDYVCDLTCDEGTADCENGPSDGCETSLGDEANCGSCGDACGDATTPDTLRSCILGGCQCEPVVSERAPGYESIGIESCDGELDSCGTADAYCPMSAGGFRSMAASPVVTALHDGQVPRGEYAPESAWAWADGEFQYDRILSELTVFLGNHEDADAGSIVAVKPGFVEFPLPLRMSSSAQPSGTDQPYAIDSPLSVADAPILGIDEIGDPWVTAGSAFSVSCSDLATVPNGPSPADGWYPYLVGFAINFGPRVNDMECDASDAACGLGGSGCGTSSETDDCADGLVCNKQGDGGTSNDHCVLPRDGDTFWSSNRVHTGGIGDFASGIDWRGTDLMYDGIRSIQPLCAAMRVVPDEDVDEFDVPRGYSRYVIEILTDEDLSGNPVPFRGNSGYGTTLDLDARDTIDVIPTDADGNYIFGPISNIGFEYDGRSLPHAPADSSVQSRRERATADYVFWDVMFVSWRPNSEGRRLPNP